MIDIYFHDVHVFLHISNTGKSSVKRVFLVVVTADASSYGIQEICYIYGDQVIYIYIYRK